MSDVLVAAPLRLEALAIKAGARRLRVRKTGMGQARSHAAVPGLRGDPAAALVVMGVCGGLDDGCEPGDVVIADELLDGERDEHEGASAGESGEGVRMDVDSHESGAGARVGPPVRFACPSAQPLAEALKHRGVTVRLGTVVSVAHIAHGEKRVELRERGAIVVDMESTWLAAAAAGRPFAVIRVVADTPSREVTRPLLTLVGAGRAALSLRRVAAVLSELVREQGAHAVLGGAGSSGSRGSSPQPMASK
jgi:4-hydroxy-3-methylbut-2-en-1-yl diphosphate reductase